MTIKLKKVLANIFYVSTALFFILFALDAPRKSDMNASINYSTSALGESVFDLTEIFTNSNYN